MKVGTTIEFWNEEFMVLKVKKVKDHKNQKCFDVYVQSTTSKKKFWKRILANPVLKAPTHFFLPNNRIPQVD